MNWLTYELPKEYSSLYYLQQNIGDKKTIEYICLIWNRTNPGDTLRIKDVGDWSVYLTGKCVCPTTALDICKWLTNLGLAFSYEKTIVTVEV